MKLAKNISIFTFFNLLNAGIPFLLLPVLTTYLSPEDYGIIDIFNSLIMLFTPIVGLSIIESINRYYFEEKEVDLKTFVSTIFTMLLKYGVIFIVIISVVGVFLAKHISESFNLPLKVLIFAAIYVYFSQIGEIILIIWRISYKTVNYGVFRIVKTLFDISFSLILIVVLDFNWEGRVVPQVITSVLFGLVVMYILYKKGFAFNKELKFNKEYKAKALSYGVPLIFHSLGGYLIAVSDRFFILYFEGVESIGIYGVAYQIGMVIGLFQNSFNQAWVPYFFSSLKINSKKRNLQIVKITYGYFLIMLLLVVIFYLITPYIYKYFIGEQFQEGVNVVLWVLLGYAFNGMYKMVVNYLFYLKQTRVIAVFTTIAATLNLVLNYFLIDLYGIVGAAQATTISFAFLFFAILIVSTKKFKIPWNLK